MRVVLDTNILVSALIAPAGNPAAIYNAWEQGKFTLLTCIEHLEELRATLQKPKVADLIKPYKAGRLVNQIKRLADDIRELPRVKRQQEQDEPQKPVIQMGRSRAFVSRYDDGTMDCIIMRQF